MKAGRPRCSVCGSKQWRKEPSSGLITCKEGHVLQNYRNETREINELGPHALRKRTLKSQRKRKEKQSRADPKLYHGERARYHYFQCLQLILRMQIQALTRMWELPPEFEAICRDLWALHLSLLPNPPPAEPYFYRQEQQDETESTSSKVSKTTAKPIVPLSTVDEEGDDAGSDHDREEEQKHDSSSSSSSSPSSSDEEDEEEEREMERLMREASVARSSSSEDEEEEEDQLDPSQKSSKDQRNEKRKQKSILSNKQYDAPVGNIAVLVVACWSLRLPITYMDLVRVIEMYDLPYLDPVRLLPPTLTRHLTKQTVQALSPHFAPPPIYIHNHASRLAKVIYKSHNIYTPEMNVAPLLWRAVRGLNGTPTLYTLAKRLASVLSVPMTLHHCLASPLKRIKQDDPAWHRYDNAPVEVTLVAVIIIVLKMAYGVGGGGNESGYAPHSKEDPLHALPDLTAYLNAIKASEKSEGETFESFISKDSDRTVLDLDDEMIDQYMDFCEKALLPREDRMNERDPAVQYFPLQPKQSEDEQPRPQLPEPPSSLPAANFSQVNNTLRPGQAYKIYSALDLLGVLPRDYERIIQRASHWTGVDEDYISGVVERFERRLCRWFERVKKGRRS